MGVARELVFAVRRLRLRAERRRLDYAAEEAARAERLAPILDVPTADLRAYEREYEGLESFHETYARRVDRLHQAGVLTDSTHWRDGKTLYVVCRALAPSVVVETGIRHGSFDAHILAALDRNGTGVLHALDLPAGPPGPFPQGYLIPEPLRSRWTPHAGDASAILPELLGDVGPVDLFLHDSDHRRPHMEFEFETGVAHLAPGGILASHDVRLSSAFADVAKAHGLRSCVIADTGIARST